MDDRTEMATTRATDAGDAEIAAGLVERSGRSNEPLPLYAVLDRRESGEWRTVDEFVDPQIAREVCALLLSLGADAKIELIEHPIP
jgi:hypothetical protein